MKKLIFSTLNLALVISGITYGIVNNSTLFTGLNNPKPKAEVLADVKIGTQTWTNKNLEVTKFRDGTTILQAKNATEWKTYATQGKPAWCYYNFNQSNGTKYGKLYNWYAVKSTKGLAPSGYHIPTKAEWEKLINFLGAGNVAGTKMKSTSGWSDGGNGTNVGGFNGLPGGQCWGPTSKFELAGTNAFWWSASANTSRDGWSWSCRVYSSGGNAIIKDIPNEYGLSVRCIKN